MTDTPLVDTIARAIANTDSHGPDLWDSLIAHAWHREMLESYRDQARAALAAMPQPIGYGIVTADDYIIGQLDGTVVGGIGWVFESDDAQLVDTPAEAREQAAEYADGRAIVVALVAVEAPDA